MPVGGKRSSEKLEWKEQSAALRPQEEHQDSDSDYLTTLGDFMIIPIKHLENGGRSERHSGGPSSSTSDT